jgi:hypothetical protein
MTTYTEAELYAAVQAGYHAPDDLPLATRSWIEGYRAGRGNPQPVVPEGYVVVPTYPTEEMLDAMYDAMLELYKAMLTDKGGE